MEGVDPMVEAMLGMHRVDEEVIKRLVAMASKCCGKLKVNVRGWQCMLACKCKCQSDCILDEVIG